MIGVAPNISVLPLKFRAGRQRLLSDGFEALAYVTMMRNNGHPLVGSNNSWGGGPYNPDLEALFDEATAAGLLTVFAAGNDGANTSLTPVYPGAYPNEGLLTVGASDHNDVIAFFSNYSAEHVDITAPGVSIYSCLLNGGYGPLNGTSMAAARGGVVALLYSQLGLNADPLVVKDAILSSVDVKSSLDGLVLTGVA